MRSGNTGPFGGAIYSGGGLEIANATIGGNSAVVGGGIYNAGSAGLLHVTLAANTASAVGGTFFEEGAVAIAASIVEGGAPQNCAGDPLTSGGYNIESGASCGLNATGDLSDTDPLLGALEGNGGPTLTHELLAGSPAIDSVPLDGCPEDDQRGITRPQGALCDRGAFEADEIAPEPTPTATPTPDEGEPPPGEVAGNPGAPEFAPTATLTQPAGGQQPAAPSSPTAVSTVAAVGVGPGAAPGGSAVSAPDTGSGRGAGDGRMQVALLALLVFAAVAAGAGIGVSRRQRR
jgi:hypothetical protein